MSQSENAITVARYTNEGQVEKQKIDPATGKLTNAWYWHCLRCHAVNVGGADRCWECRADAQLGRVIMRPDLEKRIEVYEAARQAAEKAAKEARLAELQLEGRKNLERRLADANTWRDYHQNHARELMVRNARMHRKENRLVRELKQARKEAAPMVYAQLKEAVGHIKQLQTAVLLSVAAMVAAQRDRDRANERADVAQEAADAEVMQLRECMSMLNGQLAMERRRQATVAEPTAAKLEPRKERFIDRWWRLTEVDNRAGVW